MNKQQLNDWLLEIAIKYIKFLVPEEKIPEVTAQILRDAKVKPEIGNGLVYLANAIKPEGDTTLDSVCVTPQLRSGKEGK